MNNTTLNQLIKLEQMLLDHNVRTSRQKLDELLHDDLIEIGQSGIYYTKNDVLDLLPNLPELIFNAKNFKYIELSNDKYLLVYLLETSQKGSSAKVFTYRSSIWIKNNNKWQMLFHQATATKNEV